MSQELGAGVGESVCIRTANDRPFQTGVAVVDCDPVAVQPPPVTTPTTPTTGPAGPSSGRPSIASTGPSDKVNLRVIDGDLVMSKPGEVLDSVRVNGAIRVTAPNVTIRNSYIAGRPGMSWGQPLIYAGTGTSAGLRIERTEVAPSDPAWIVNGIYGFGFTATQVNVHHVIDQVHIFGDDVTVTGSWLHDNYHGPDPGQPNKETHDDNIQIQRGRNIQVSGNLMGGAHNAAVQVTQGTGPVANFLFSSNWVSGGGCTLNIAESGVGVIRGLAVNQNRFGPSRFNCPILVTPETKAISRFDQNALEEGGAVPHFTCRAEGQPNWRC